MDGLSLADFTTDLLDDEPRVDDWKIAESLGVRLFHFHELTERHLGSLQKLGNLSYGTINSGNAGRPGRRWRFTFNQAIFLIIKSEAPNALAVQIHVVTIYGLWAQGKLKPVDAETAQQIAVATTELQERAPELVAALQELLSRVSELPTIGARVESLQRTAIEIQERLGNIWKRRDAPVRNRDVYDRVVIDFYLGRCPCCQRADRVILDIRVDPPKQTRLYSLDHWTDNPYKNALHEMWPVCDVCNGKFKHDTRYRAEMTDRFRVFQSHIQDILGARLI